MKKVNDLTQGNIATTLIKLAIPITGAFLLQMAYNFIDMLWIGRVGSNAVAAVGTASFFINLGYALNSIIITGAGIKVAQKIGEKKTQEVKEYINSAILLNIILTLTYSLFIIVFRKNLINFFDLKNEFVENTAVTYLLICGNAIIFNFMNILYGRIFNSLGNSKIAFKISSIGIILNIILDPIFIFVLNMGVFGAAIATIISQIINFIIFIKIGKKYFDIDFNFGIFNINSEKLRDIVTLGTPMALQRVLFTIFGIILAKIIAKWGPSAIAAQKIGLQIEALSYMASAGMNGAVSAFIGQNYGAKKYDRIINGYKTAFLLTLIWGVFTTTLFIVFAKYLVMIFVKDSKTIEVGINYLRIIGLSQIFMCIEIVTNAAFSGIGKPKIPSSISIGITWLRIPFAFILSSDSLFELNGVWISIALTSVIKGILSSSLFFGQIKKFKLKIV
ncbi:MAG: hypothetical protein PWP46_1410 [Fusobacteriaceae bacterium]|jgi:putative MATE family efflux protein|nr:hypothetical protein [Fusobacteriaceae bacterium]